MYRMSKTEENPERTVEGFVSAARLPEEPRLARLCTFVSRTGKVTIEDVVNELGTSWTTAFGFCYTG